MGKPLTHEEIRSVIYAWNYHWLTKEGERYATRARLCDANMAHHLADMLLKEQEAKETRQDGKDE